MSSDPGFATLSFPSLRTTVRDDSEDRARVAGHAAGYAAGLRAAEVDVAARVAAMRAEHEATLRHLQARSDLSTSVLNAAVVALHERTVPVLESAHAAIAEAAIQLAEAIVGCELGEAGTAAKSALFRALDSVDTASVQVVRLNPSDLAALDPSTIEAAGVALAADPSLARGDAVTEFSNGFLDARISTALARARAAIEEARP